MGRPDSIMLYVQRQRLLRREVSTTRNEDGELSGAWWLPVLWAQAGGTGPQQVIKAQGTGLVLTHSQTEVGSV